MDFSPIERPRAGRLLARVHVVARARHLSPRTEEAYRSWIVRYVRFTEMRHPDVPGEAEIRRFLEWLATVGKVAPSALNQAHAALLFLYRDVLGDPSRCPAEPARQRCERKRFNSRLTWAMASTAGTSFFPSAERPYSTVGGELGMTFR
jgi:pyruvate-formate lyase-activating enzyme